MQPCVAASLAGIHGDAGTDQPLDQPRSRPSGQRRVKGRVGVTVERAKVDVGTALEQQLHHAFVTEVGGEILTIDDAQTNASAIIAVSGDGFVSIDDGDPQA